MQLQARDRTKITMRFLRPGASIISESAEKNPAIGALILSLREPRRLKTQRIILYELLNMARKHANFAQS